MNDQNTNHEHSVVFAAIDAAADKFQKLHGNLNENSNFDLYGEQLENAVIEFNKQNGTDHRPDIVLEKWTEDGQQIYDALMENDEMRFMNEALENRDKFKAGWKE